MKGLVSVIVPVYNRQHLVSETINSILSQSYKNFEIILINDGSQDDSLSILRRYEIRFPDQVRVLDQKNQGQVIARNNGIQLARGEFIAFLDSDDLWVEDKLERQIPLFQPGVGLVYSGIEVIDEEGKTVRIERADEAVSGYIYPQLLVKNRMTGGTVVVRAEALSRVGVFSTDFEAAENWDLWLRVCSLYNARLIADPLVKYRVHSANMSADGKLMLNSKLQIIKKHCDLKSKNSAIRYYSHRAYADYHYRQGLNYFSEDEFKYACICFLRTIGYAYSYEDAWIRLLRSCMGSYGNKLLRSIKQIFSQRQKINK